MALSDQPEAFAKDLGDDQSCYGAQEKENGRHRQ